MSELSIYNRLMQEIGNASGVCGLMGNLQKESGLKSNNMQNSYETKLGMTDETYTAAVDAGIYTAFQTDRVGYGLAQWTSQGRKAALLKFAQEMKKSIGNEEMQVEFLIKELSTSYKAVLLVLKNAKTVEEASDMVVLKFEVPASVLPAAGEAAKNKTLEERRKLGISFFEKYKEENMKTIVIDAGHGLKTSGKRCLKKIDKNETREWILNNRIADMVTDALKQQACKVIRADDTSGAVDVSLEDRVKKANNAGADLYISIHHNAGIAGGAGGGTVVYYSSSKAERKTQAQNLYNAIVGQTGLVGNRSSKVINKGFYVIKNTKMPAFLIENGYMDSTHDTPIILTQEHASKTAQGIVQFIKSMLKLNEKAETKPVQSVSAAPAQAPAATAPAPAAGYKVRVTVNVLNVRTGPGATYQVTTTIKSGGVYTITEEKNGWGRLKSGAGWISLKYTERV